MKLRSKMLIVLFVAAVMPAIIIIFAYQAKLRNTLEQNHQTYIESLSKENIAYVSNHIDDLEKLAFKLRTQISVIDFLKNVSSSNYQDVQNQLRTSQIGEKLELILDTYSDISYIGIVPQKDGVKMCRGNYSALNNMCTSNEFVTNHSNPTGGVTWVDLSDADRTYLVLVTSIIDGYNENDLGYLSIVIDVKKIFQSAGGVQRQQKFIVVNENDQPVFENNVTLQSDAISTLMQNEENHWQNITVNGVEYTASVNGIASVKWKILFLFGVDGIQQNLEETSTFMLRLVLIFVFFAICSVVYFHIKIYAPVQKLTDAMNQAVLLPDKLDTPSGKDEIGQLGSAFKHLMERISDQITEIEAAERAKAELEICALQAQITPHFLYNTLNAIKCLSRLGRTQDISSMAEALIDLLRISASKERLITITQEIEYVQAYAELMSLRAGYQIKIDSHIDQDLGQIKLPKLSLQPIVENSIIHGGIEKHDGKMEIRISVHNKNPYVEILIEDDGVGIPPEVLDRINNGSFDHRDTPSRFSGIGINNIRQRFCLEYGSAASVFVQNGEKEGTLVQIKFNPNGCVL